jgi:hypothetical protein
MSKSSFCKMAKSRIILYVSMYVCMYMGKIGPVGGSQIYRLSPVEDGRL